MSYFLKDENELIREVKEGRMARKEVWNFWMVWRFIEAYDLATFWWPLEECLDLRLKIKW